MEKKLKFKLTYYELFILRDTLSIDIRRFRRTAKECTYARQILEDEANKLEGILKKIEIAGGM